MKTTIFSAVCSGVFCAVPIMASADVLNCAFETVCGDVAGCLPAEKTLHITYQPKPLGPKGMMSRATLVDKDGASSGIYAIRNDIKTFVSGDVFDGESLSLTVASDGAARLVRTTTSPLHVDVLAGNCEVQE